MHQYNNLMDQALSVKAKLTPGVLRIDSRSTETLIRMKAFLKTNE